MLCFPRSDLLGVSCMYSISSYVCPHMYNAERSQREYNHAYARLMCIGKQSHKSKCNAYYVPHLHALQKSHSANFLFYQGISWYSHLFQLNGKSGNGSALWQTKTPPLQETVEAGFQVSYTVLTPLCKLILYYIHDMVAIAHVKHLLVWNVWQQQ